MRATLRSVSPADPRPAPFDDAVLTRACQPHAEAMTQWLRTSGVPHEMPAEAVRYACVSCLRHCKGDPWKTAQFLEKVYAWPMDLDGARIIERMAFALPSALKVEAGEWVLRTGIRFPAKYGDRIEWIDEAGLEHAGQVAGVESAFAAALVTPSKTAGRVVPMLNAEAVRVFAENVFGNATQGKYAVYATPEQPFISTARERHPDEPVVTALYQAAPQLSLVPSLGIQFLADEDLDEAFAALGSSTVFEPDYPCDVEPV